jgi:integrase
MRGDNGLAARTVGHVHRVLHRALGHAATWGVVVQNVASLVSPPRVASTEIEMLREDDIKAVLQKLRGRSMHPIAVVGLATGMRRGELLALRWQDVDLDAGKIRVERSLEQTKAGLRFKSPKTKHGRRTITIDPATVAELRAHRKGQAERRLTLGLGKPLADALVFPTWDFQVRSPNALTKEWSVAMAEAGLKVTLHSLRHTHASSLIAAGVDVLTISRRLGHASPTITLGVYGHLFANTDDRAAQVMADLFSKVSTD